MVVATSSSRLPKAAFQRSSDMRPPAPAISATESAAARDARASPRCPTAKEHCSIAQHAAAKASTATTVCTRSCQVKVAPSGRGQPAVQFAWEATRKKAHEIQSESEGLQAARTAGRERMPRAASATRLAPATIPRSAASNQCSVGIPTAPSSET